VDANPQLKLDQTMIEVKIYIRDSRQNKVLEGIDLTIDAKGIFAVTGPNGIWKKHPN